MTSSTPSVVVVGSLNADLVVRVHRFPSPGETIHGSTFDVFAGGKGGNQACAAARLGAAVAMVGQVGGDGYGAWLRAQLSGTGADVSRVAIDDRVSSGIAVITTDASGENHIVVVAGANGTFTADRLAPALSVIRSARVLLLQLEIPMPTVERAAAEACSAGATVILDPAPAAAVPDQLLALSSIVTPNEVELALLAGARVPAAPLPRAEIDRLARALIARGAATVVVKLGARGARLITRADGIDFPAPAVAAVDTTAAGDAFNGALATMLSEGAPLDAAIRFACAAAAVSVTRHGAQPSMPTRRETEEVLGSGK